MGIYKRGENGLYWYRFVWHGKRIRMSTKQANARVASQMEAAHKTSLAKAEVGIRSPKRAPTLADFAKDDFLPFVRSQFAQKPKTLEYYQWGVKNLTAGKLAHEPIDAITAQMIAGYATSRREKGLQTSTINRELMVLRRMFKLAAEWDKVEKVLTPVRLVPGERRRDRVLTTEEEKRYLENAPALLRDVSMLLFDCGLRPEECMRLRWDEIRDDALHVPYGKTKSARRSIVLSERALGVLEVRKSKSEWVFPADTRSGHIEPSSLRKAHYRTCIKSKVARFQMYALRHTCLTRWAAHMDPYTLAYLAGHSDMVTTKRYVHPQLETVRHAMVRARESQLAHMPTTEESHMSTSA